MSQRQYADSELVGDGLQNSHNDSKWGMPVSHQLNNLTPPPPLLSKPPPSSSSSMRNSKIFQMALNEGYDDVDDDGSVEQPPSQPADPEAEQRSETLAKLETLFAQMKKTDDLRARVKKAPALKELKEILKAAKERFCAQDDSDADTESEPAQKRARPAEPVVAAAAVSVAAMAPPPPVVVAAATTALKVAPTASVMATIDDELDKAFDRGAAESAEKSKESKKRERSESIETQSPAPAAKKAAPAAVTVVPITANPPFGMLHYMFGSKFVAEVAQVLVAKGAQRVVGTPEQNSLLSNLALSVIELARPDLADEADRHKSKSSSVPDKETVNVVRQVNQAPKALSADVEKKRLAQLAAAKGVGSAGMQHYRLLGFAALMAANVALNACIVVSPDRAQLAVATALGAHKKHKFAAALGPLIGAKMLSAPVVDIELAESWRVTANRLSLLPCKPTDLLLVQSAVRSGGGSGGAGATPAKRVRVNESANVVFDDKTATKQQNAAAPPPPPTTAPAPKFSMQIKTVGSFNRVVGDSENVFKYNVKALLHVYGKELTLVPNSDLTALIAMVFEALNTHSLLHSLIAPVYQKHVTASNCNVRKPAPYTYAPVKVLPGVFSCITDTTVESRTKKYYDEHPEVVRTHHDMFVQRSREIALAYVSDMHATDKEVAAFSDLALAVSHVLFGFLRLDEQLAGPCVRGAAVHLAGRVVESARDTYGTPVLLGCNELPVGVSFRAPEHAKALLKKMWCKWLAHLKLAPAGDGVLIRGAADLFVERYNDAQYGAHQWLVDYLKPSDVRPTPEQRAEYREIMVPVIYALFPPSFMGPVPVNK